MNLWNRIHLIILTPLPNTHGMLTGVRKQEIFLFLHLFTVPFLRNVDYSFTWFSWRVMKCFFIRMSIIFNYDSEKAMRYGLYFGNKLSCKNMVLPRSNIYCYYTLYSEYNHFAFVLSKASWYLWSNTVYYIEYGMLFYTKMSKVRITGFLSFQNALPKRSGWQLIVHLTFQFKMFPTGTFNC